LGGCHLSTVVKKPRPHHAGGAFLCLLFFLHLAIDGAVSKGYNSTYQRHGGNNMHKQFFEFFAEDNDTNQPNATRYGFSKEWKKGTVYRYAKATDLKPLEEIEV
jgi:hypothetical protein